VSTAKFVAPILTLALLGFLLFGPQSASAGTMQWGDADCSGSVTPVDALKVARVLVGLPAPQTQPCPVIGDLIQIQGYQYQVMWGDVDCSGTVTIGDAQKILRFDAGLSVSQTPPCPGIGDMVTLN
jgi:hypothetical protein